MKKHLAKEQIPKTKTLGLHPRNAHTESYDFTVLIKAHPALADHVKFKQDGNASIDFSAPLAVKVLNAALLKHHYTINAWDIPNGYLCPPIPGRVDYIHYVAKLLRVKAPDQTKKSKRSSVRMLDIGTGANGIYTLLASKLYGWSCTASDIDPASLENVASIVARNPELEKRVTLRLQNDNSHIFENIIKEGEQYDISVCNPPFHASLEEALKENQKKSSNLSKNRQKNSDKKATESSADKTIQNFGGQKAELWCNGGEIRFLRKMLKESKKFGSQCKWFTTLVSKSENLQPSLKILSKLAATEVKEINMQHGNKQTRILAWRF